MINVTARPIHFTSNVALVEKRLAALGLARVYGNSGDTWQVFAAPAGGRVAVHQVEIGNDMDGVSKLGFEVPDGASLETIAASFRNNPGGAISEMVDSADGKALEIKTIDGLKFLIDIVDNAESSEVSTGSTAKAPGVEVTQMWFTNNTPAAREVLLALGATELVSTQGLGWDDCRLPGGGRTPLHQAGGNPRVSLGFMSAGPLEQPKHQVDLAGDDASIVDEAWGRYLDLAPVTVNKPETGLDGALTWVNEEKQDFYGYQVHQSPVAHLNT